MFMGSLLKKTRDTPNVYHFLAFNFLENKVDQYIIIIIIIRAIGFGKKSTKHIS